MQWLRSLVAFAAMAVALLLWAEDADARLVERDVGRGQHLAGIERQAPEVEVEREMERLI